MKNRLNPFLGTLAVIAMTQASHATSDIWDGSQNTGTWSDAANWSSTPVIVPGTGDTATFNSAGGSNDTIDLGVGGVTIGSILFNTSSVAAYTIGSGAAGSQTLTLNNGGAITANNTITNNQTFNANLVLGTDATTQTYAITNNDAENSMTFAGAITGGAGGAAGAKTLNITTGALSNGSIFMSGAITDGGASSLALAFAPVSGNVQINMGNVGSTYSGGTSLATNVRLHVNAGAGAGLGTGDVTVATGGQVYLNSAGTYTNDFFISGTKWGTESTALGAIRIGGGANTLTGNVTLNANAGISVDSGRSATITGDITGAFNLDRSSTAAGTGSLLTLTGTNDYGTTTITRGVISFAKQASLYNSTASKWTKAFIDVESGAALALGVGDSASGYWDAAGVTAFLGATQMGLSTTTDGFKSGSLIGFDTTNATAGIFTYGAIGNIGGSSGNGLVKLGTGTLVLNGVNTYTGPTAVEGGTLTLSNANPLTVGATSVNAGTLALTNTNAVQNSALTLKNGATLQLRNNSDTIFNSSGVVTLNSVSAQTVTLDVGNNGSGTDHTLALANGISYAGPVSGIAAGTYTTQINVTGANGYALSVPSVTFGNAGSYASGSPRNFVLSLNPTSADVSIGTVTLTGEGSRNTVALTLDGTSVGNKITGAISMPAGRPLTKKGSGTWTLSGTNSYTGATTVTTGKLSIGTGGTINNTSGVVIGTASTAAISEFNYNSSTALTQAVSFAAGSTGGTLSGSGTINQAVSITTGNTLAIGNSPGIMNFANTLGLNGTTVMEIDGTVGAGATGGHDFANLTGSGAAGVLTYGGALTLDIGAIFGVGSYTWNLFDFASETGTLASISLDDQYSGSLSHAGSGIWGLVDGDNTWQFTESTGVLGLTVVPEPRAALLGGLGLLALLRRRRA